MPRARDGAEGSDGNWITTLPGLLHEVIEQLLFPCWAFRLRDLPFFFAPSAGGAAPVTGTFIFHEHGKVRLCLQFEPSSLPYIFLDLPITTADFVAGVRGGGWRIAFACNDSGGKEKPPLHGEKVWEVSFNGKKAGFATRPEMTERDTLLLHATRKVSTGAAIMAPQAAETATTEGMRRCKYLRGKFERVVGSVDSESYHLVDPEGDLGQVLSLFFLRRR